EIRLEKCVLSNTAWFGRVSYITLTRFLGII
ncbi:hypothetical protein SLEP1_g60322, partial [Rubroshorea leprosula]